MTEIGMRHCVTQNKTEIWYDFCCCLQMTRKTEEEEEKKRAIRDILWLISVHENAKRLIQKDCK